MRPISEQSHDTFAAGAARCLHDLQTRVASIIGAVPNLEPQRPVDLANGLEIDLKLAWRVFRLARAQDPFESARHVPGSAGFRIFLNAAAQSGVNAALLAPAETAYEGLQAFIDTHAGSRRDFDLMVAGLSSDGDGRLELEHRRQLFTGASAVWGVQCRVHFAVNIAAPAQDPDRFDLLSIRGVCDLRQIRPRMLWRLATLGIIKSDGCVERPPGVLGLASLQPVSTDRPALLEPYCSTPPPQFVPIPQQGTTREFELVPGTIGRQSDRTIVVAEFSPSHDFRVRQASMTGLHFAMRLRTPAEFALFDLWLHEDLLDEDAPVESRHCGDLFARNAALSSEYRDNEHLPGTGVPQQLGKGLGQAGVREIDWFVRMLREAFGRVGWDPQRFALQRLAMPYPPIPSTLLLERPLPES